MTQPSSLSEPNRPSYLASPREALITDLAEVTLRPARVDDVPGIIELIGYWAARGKMLNRPLPIVVENIQDFILAERRTREGTALLGTVALHILWSDIAEVRCLAVQPSERGSGSGRKLVEACELRAKTLGVPTLFAWTLSVAFFEKCGYARIVAANLHPRVLGRVSAVSFISKLPGKRYG